MGITHTSLKLLVILVLVNVLISDNSFDRQIKRSKRDLDENESTGDALYEVDKREEIAIPSQNNDITVDSPKDSTSILKDSILSGDKKSNVGKKLKETKSLKTKLKKDSKVKKVQNNVKSSSLVQPDDEDARLLQGMDSNVDHPMANNDITKRYDASADIMHGEMMGMGDSDNYDTTPNDLKRSTIHTIYTTDPHSKFKFDLNRLSIDVKRRSVENLNEQNGGTSLRLRVNNKSNGLESNANSTEGNTKPVSLQVRSQLGSALFSTDKFNSQTYTSPSLSQAKVFHERQPRHFHHHHHHHRRHHLHHRHHHYHNEFEPERFGESYFRRNGFEWNQPLSYYSPFFRAPPYSMSWGRFSNPYEYHMGRRWISSPSYVRSNVEGALDPRLNSGIFANGFNPGIALPDSENLMAESLRKPLQNEGERMALEHLQNIHMSTLREFAQSQEERRRELEAEEFRFQHSKLMNPYLPELQHVPLENPFHLNDFRQNHNSLLANRFSRNFEKTSFQDPYLEMKPEQEPNNVFDQFSVHSPSLYESQFDPSISEFHHHSDFISHFKNEPKNFIDGVTPSAVNRPGILRVTGMEKRSFNEEGKFQNSQMERPEFEMQFSNKQIDDMNPNREYSRFHNEDYPSYQSSYGNRISGRHSVQEYRDSDQPSMFRDNESDQIESKTTSKLNSLFDTSNVDAHRPIDSPDSAPLLEGSLPDSSTLLKNPGSVPDFHDQLNAGVQDGDQQNEISEQAEALREDKEFAKISQIQEEMYKKLNDVLPIGDMPRPDLYPTESKKAGLKHLVPSQTNEIKKKEDIYGYKKYEVPIEQKYKNNFKKDHLPEDIKLNLTISNATSDDLSIFDKKSNTSVTSTLPLTPQVASSLTPVTLPITSEKRRSTKNLLIEVSNSKVVSIDNSFNEEKRENTILLEKKIHQNVTKKSEIGHRNKAHANDKKFNQKKNLALKRKNTIFLKGKKKNDIIVRRPQIVFHPPPEIYHRPPIILHRPPLIIQRPPIVYHQPPVVVHRPPVIYAQPPIIFHQPSPVVHQPFLNSKDHWGLMTETNFKHIGSSLSDGGEWSSILPGNVLGTNNQVENYPKDNEDSNNINYDNNLEMTLKPDMTDTILKSDETTNVKNSFELKEKTSNLLLNTVLNSTSLKKSSIHSKNKEKKQLRVRKKREVKKNNDHKGTKKDVVVNRPPIIYHPPPEIYHRPDIVIHRPPIVIHRPPIIYHQPPVIVHRPAVVYHQPPIIFHQPPPAVQQPLLYSHDTFVVHPSFVAQHMGSILRTAHHYIGPPRLITQLGSPLFESSLQEEKPAQESLQVAPSSNNYPIEQSNLNGFTNYQGEGENTALNEENQYSQMQNMPNTDDQGALSNEMVSNKNTFNSLNGRTLENTLTNSETDQAFMNNAVDNPSMQPESYNSIQDNYSENNNQMFKRSNIQNVIVHQPPVVLNHREVIFHQVPLLFHRPPIIVHQAPLVNHQPSIFYQQPNGIFHASSNMMNHEPTFSSYSLANHLPMANITNTKNSNSSGVEEDTYEHSFNEITDNTKSSLKLSLYSDNFDQSEKIDSLADPLIDNSFLINHPSLTVENGNFLGNDDKSNNVKSHNTLIDKLKIDSAYNSNSDLMKSYVSNRKNDSHVKITQLSVPSSFHRLKKNKIDKLKHGDKKYSKREVVDLTHKITQPYFNSTRNTYTRDAQTTSHIGVKSTGFDRSFSESSSSEQQATMGGVSGGVSGEENSPIGHLGGEEFSNQQSSPYKRTYIAKNENEDNFEKDTYRERRSKNLHLQKNHHQHPSRRHRVVVGRPDIIYHQAPEIVHRPPLIVHRPDIVIHRPSVIVHRPPVVVHRPAIMYHQPPVVFNSPLPVIHQPNAISHDMYVAHSYPHRIGSHVFPSGGIISQVSNVEHEENMGQLNNIQNDENIQNVDSGMLNSEPNEEHDFGIQGPSAYNNGFPSEGWGTGPNAGVDVTPNNVENIGADYESPVRNQYAPGAFLQEDGYSQSNLNAQPVTGNNQVVHFSRGEPNNILNQFGPLTTNNYVPLPEEEHPWTKSKVPKKKSNQVSGVKKQILVSSNHGDFSGDVHDEKYPHENSNFVGCEGSNCHEDGYSDGEPFHEGNERFADGYDGHNDYHDLRYSRHHPAGVHATVLYRPDVVFHPRPELYHRPDIIVHRPDVVIHRPSVVIHQPPVLVHRPAVIVHQPPIVFHQPPPVVHRPIAVSHDNYLVHDNHEHVGSHLEHAGHVVGQGGYDVGTPFENAKDIDNLHSFSHPHYENIHNEFANEGNLINTHGFSNNLNDNFDSHTHNVPDYNLQPINNIGTSEDFDNPSPAQFQEEKDLENVNSENLSSKSVVTHHKGHKKKKKNKKKTKVRREIKESNHTESEIEVMKKSKIQNSSKKHHVTVIHRPDVVFHQRPEVIHRPDIIVHRPDVVINRPDVIIHRPAVIVHKPPMVIHQAPIVFHHSHPMMHQPIQHQNNLYVQNTYPDHDGSHIENLEHSYPVDIAPQINNSPHIYSEPVNVGHIMMERVHSNGGHVGDTPTMGVSNNVLENEYHLNLDNNCNNYNCHNFGGEPVGHEHLIGPIGFAPQYPDTEDDDARSHIPKKNNQIAAKKHHVTVIHRPDIIYHPKPEIVHRPDVIVHRPDIVIHRPSVVVHRPPVVVHKSPVIIHQPPIILHQPNPIINQPIHQSHDLYAMKPVPIQVGSRLEHVSSNTNIHELGPTSETSSNILDQGNFHETQTFPINGQNSLNNGHEVLDQPLNLNDQGNNGMESINYLSSNERGLETQLGNNLQSSVGNKNLNSSFVNIDENHEEPNSIIGNYKQDYTINNNHIGQTGGELNVRSGELSCDENSDPQCNRSKKNKVSKLKNKKKLKLKNITGFKRDFGFGSEGISRDCIGSHCGECHDGHCGSDISDHQGEESFGHHGFGDVIGQHAGSGIIGHGGISGHGIWGDHGDHWGHGHENTWEHHNDHHHHHADEQNIVVQRPDIVFHPRPELYHRPDIIVHRPDIVIHRPSVVIHQPPVLVHRPAVIYHQPPVVFHQPGPVVHRPRVVSHDMYVTHDQHEHVGSQIEHAGGGTIAHAGYYENHDIGHSHDDDDDERGEEGHHGHEGGYEGGRSGGEHHDELGYGGGHHFEHGFGLGGHEFNCLGGNCGHEDEHAFKRFLVDSPNELHQAKAKRHRVVVFRPPIIYHPPPEIYHRADLIVHRPDVIISRPSVVVHRPDVVIHRPNIVYHQPPVVFYTPPPHIHQPIIKSHDSYVTHPIYRHIGSNVEHVGGVFLPHTYPANNLVPFQDSNLNQYTNEDALQENSQTPVNNFIGQNYHNQEQTQETEELEGLHEENPDEADNSVLNNVNINPHQDLVSSTSPINAQQNLVNEPQPGYNVAGLGKSKVEKHRKHKKRKHSRRRHRRNIVAKRSIKSTKKVTKNNKKKKSQNSFKSTNKISSRKTKKTEIENSDDKKKGKASKKNDIIVKRPPVIYHPPPEIYHRPPIIVHRPPLVIRRPPIIYHQPPVIVHRPAVVYHQPPLIFHQPPPAVSQPILKSHDTFMMHPAARLTHMGSMVTNAGTYVGVPEHRFMYQGGMGFFRAPEQDHQVGYSAVDNDNSRGENTYMSTPHMDDFNQGVGGGISDLSSHQRNSMLENIDTEQHQIGDGQYIGGQGRDQLSNEQNLVLQEPSMQQQNINDGEQQFIDSSNNQVGMGSSESSYASQSGSDDAFGRNSIPSPAEDNLPDNDESSENNEEEEEDSDNRVEQHTEKKQKVVANESKRKSIEKPLLKIIKGIKSQHKYQKDDEIDRKKRQTPFFNPYQLRQDVPQFNPLFFKPQRRHHKTSVNIDVVGKRSISDTLKPGNKNRNHFLF
ncbi:uncharacterized protein LOC100210570 isoform X2 [Hydra vulgaris]|uniref:Uncharacterized protein LOC100210570 isoform X2 n=1 Tax=Hydra vulgaris TaxID=6087 RepID=A0ABM4D924_HYDVU